MPRTISAFVALLFVHVKHHNDVQDLVCICVDVGPHASQSAGEWQDVLRRILATRMIHNRAHMEVAIIAYGSDNTKNCLWSEEQPEDYAGVDVVSVCFLRYEHDT